MKHTGGRLTTADVLESSDAAESVLVGLRRRVVCLVFDCP